MRPGAVPASEAWKAKFPMEPVPMCNAVIFSCLIPHDQGLALKGEAATIQFDRYGTGGKGAREQKPNVWKATIAYFDEHAPVDDPGWNRKLVHRAHRNRLRKWFVRQYSLAAAGGGRTTELPRQRKDAPTIADKELVLATLTHPDHRWEDQWKNWRRHESLGHFIELAEEAEEAGTITAADKQHLQAVRAMLQRTHRSAATMTKLTVQHFGLRKRSEKFKPVRNTASAQRSARILDAQEPMVEVYYMKRKVERNKASGQPRKAIWHKQIRTLVSLTANQRVAGHVAEKTLRWDELAFQLMASVDGATVHAEAGYNVDARYVYYKVGLAASINATVNVFAA